MCTQNIPFYSKTEKSPQIILNLQLRDFFLGTQERVRNSRGKRAISVGATDVLLYIRQLFYPGVTNCPGKVSVSNHIQQYSI